MTDNCFKYDVCNFINSDGVILEKLLVYKTTLESLQSSRALSQKHSLDLDEVNKSLQKAAADCQSDLCDLGYIEMM